jgi:hypothetical protein
MISATFKSSKINSHLVSYVAKFRSNRELYFGPILDNFLNASLVKYWKKRQSCPCTKSIKHAMKTNVGVDVYIDRVCGLVVRVPGC